MASSVPLPEVPPKPRVSVVIVAHNAEGALRRSLGALEKSRDRERIEVLVVDAGSRDGCPRMDAEFPSVTMLRMPRNFGKTRARNIGMRTAQSELLLFLDPEVEVRPDTVSRLADLLESRDDAAAAAPALDDPAGKPVETAFRLPSTPELFAAAVKGTKLARVAPEGDAVPAVEDTAFLVRRNFLAGMNYLDEKRFSEYWSMLEVCWQIRNAGKKILLRGAAGAVLHPAARVEIDETAYAADRVAGAACYVGKHAGFVAGIMFRVKCFFAALGSFRIPLALAILSGKRVDPTQG